MLTKIEGATLKHSDECGCGGESCDGSGFPEEVVTALFKHEETGHYWGFAWADFDESAADAYNEKMFAQLGMVALMRPPMEPHVHYRVYPALPDGTIPRAFDGGMFTIDSRDEDCDWSGSTSAEMFDHACNIVESFHMLPQADVSVPDTLEGLEQQLGDLGLEG